MIPNFPSLVHKISWFTQLNAFDKSRNIKILYSPLFLCSYNLFTILLYNSNSETHMTAIYDARLIYGRGGFHGYLDAVQL